MAFNSESSQVAQSMQPAQAGFLGAPVAQPSQANAPAASAAPVASMPGAAANAAGSAAPPQNAAATNNDGPFAEFFRNMWHSNGKGRQTAAPQPQQVQPQQPMQMQQPVAPVSIADQQRIAMEHLGVTAPQISPEMQQAFQQGDFRGLQEVLAGMQRQMFGAALQVAKQLATVEAQKAQAAAVDSAKAYMGGNDARRALNEALPYTRDPALGPVAESVMSRALETGANQETAIKMVAAYFNSIGDRVKMPAPVAQNYGGMSMQYPGSPAFQGPQSERDVDWMALLQGGSGNQQGF